MDIKDILIQLIGAVAWVFLLFSYYRKNTNQILVFQIISTSLYCVHYYFLGAYSGMLMCACSAIFDYGYYKSDKDKYIYIISIPVRVVCGAFSFKTWLDVLPIIASLIDGYMLTKEKKFVVIGAIVYYTLWVIYNISVSSYSGAILDGVLVLSNLSILLFNYNILNKKDKTGTAVRR